MTLPEIVLWRTLRTRDVGGWKFRRQHPKGRYVLDFYCEALKLAVEIDGDIHGFGEQPRKDAERDAWLRLCGVETLRIPARDVLHDLDGVHLLLQARIAERAMTLKSLPTG
jgi:very-short-patch-repair endonuclease